jgi:hypothetical protein
MKNVVWDIKTQFVLHRRHITSPLYCPANVRFEVFTAVGLLRRVASCHPDDGSVMFLRNVGSYKSHTA